MGALLDRIKGVDFEPNKDLENIPQIPDEVPDEWTAEQDSEPLAADPPPAQRRPDPMFKPVTYGKVTPAMQRKIAEQISMYIELFAMPAAMRDPVCGGAVQDQAEALGKAFAKILSRYPEAAHKMLASGVLGDWIAVGMAAKPIAQAIYHHHIAKDIEQEGAPDDFSDFGDTYRPGQ